MPGGRLRARPYRTLPSESRVFRALASRLGRLMLGDARVLGPAANRDGSQDWSPRPV